MKQELNTYLQGAGKIDEVILFRSLYRIMQQKYQTTLIEETHQNYITFQSKLIKQPVKRELSDLWVITFSPKKRLSKMTFLQAKYEKRQNPLTKEGLRFKGEFFQYELLSSRPLIQDQSRFNFPPDILSYTDFQSIGTYGVFFHDTQGRIDMAYSIAKYLKCGKRSLFNRQTSRNFLIDQVDFGQHHTTPYCGNVPGYCPKCREYIATDTLDDFVDRLLHLEIGASIDTKPAIVEFLARFFTSLQGDPVAAQFLDFLRRMDGGNLNDIIAGVDIPPPMCNLLLINVDTEDSEKPF